MAWLGGRGVGLFGGCAVGVEGWAGVVVDDDIRGRRGEGGGARRGEARARGFAAAALGPVGKNEKDRSSRERRQAAARGRPKSKQESKHKVFRIAVRGRFFFSFSLSFNFVVSPPHVITKPQTNKSPPKKIKEAESRHRRAWSPVCFSSPSFFPHQILRALFSFFFSASLSVVAVHSPTIII